MGDSVGDSVRNRRRAQIELRRRGWLIGLLAVGWVAMIIGGALIVASLDRSWLATLLIGILFGLGVFVPLSRDQKRRRRELSDACDSPDSEGGSSESAERR